MRPKVTSIMAALMICLPIGGGAHVALGAFWGELGGVKPVVHWTLTTLELVLMCCCLVMLCLIAPRSRRARAK